MSKNYVKRQLPTFTAIPKSFTQLLEQQKIKASDIGLWYMLDQYADNETKEAFPSIKTLADKLSCSENTIRDSIRRLEKAGCLIVEERRCEKQNLTHLYTLVFFLEETIQEAPVNVEVVQNLKEGGSNIEGGGGSKFEDELRTNYLTNNSSNLEFAKTEVLPKKSSLENIFEEMGVTLVEERSEPKTLFEYLCVAVGMDYRQLPESARSPFGKAVKELKKLYPKHDERQIGEEALRRAVNYSFQYPNMAITIHSLMKYWAGLDKQTAVPVSEQQKEDDRWARVAKQYGVK